MQATTLFNCGLWPDVACTGGQGQYGRVVGYMEPLPEDEPERVIFSREIVGNAIPPSFLPACEKGFRDAANSGGLTGHPVQVRHPAPRALHVHFLQGHLSATHLVRAVVRKPCWHVTQREAQWQLL